MSHDFVDRMMEQSKVGKLRSPVSETLDMHMVEFGRGEAVYEMPARAELSNPLGVIQGGVATALADAAMAAATTVCRAGITGLRNEIFIVTLRSIFCMSCLGPVRSVGACPALATEHVSTAS